MQLRNIIIHTPRPQPRIALALAPRLTGVRRGHAVHIQHRNRIERGHLLSHTHDTVIAIPPPAHAARVVSRAVRAGADAGLGRCFCGGLQPRHDGVVGEGGHFGGQAEPAR